jgi:hypothetical protein
VTAPRTGRPWNFGLISGKDGRLTFFLQNVRTGSGAQPVSYSMGTGTLYPE